MTITTKRIALIVGSGLLALGVAAGVRASAQNTNQDPAPFNHPRMGHPGPGGPMGFGGPMGPEGALRMLQMMADRIGLTDAQKEQLKSIAAAHRDEWKALADRARSAHEAVHEAVLSDTVDEALIRSRSAEAATVQADIAVAAARARAEAWQVLTPEQKTEVQQMQSRMRERMKERRGAFWNRVERLFDMLH
jgi:Spy/CpxP family protein refolding chaperone